MSAFVRSLISVLCFVGFAGTANAAAKIVAQAPCTSASGTCLQFAGGAAIPVIRAITFIAPSAGTAAVTFHGSLYCANNSISDKVVDLVTQIVTDAAAAPAADKPGGMRLAEVLKDSNEHAQGTSDSFNLASTRAVRILAAGKRNFYFKIAPLKMDANTICYVYNAAFTVYFVP